MLYSGITNQPEYATEAALSNKYNSLIADVDEQILKSTSAFNLADKLESLNYPSNILFVSLERDHDDALVIKGESLEGPSSTTIINGFGYGNIGLQNIVIISRSVNKHGINKLKLFLSHEATN